MKDKPGNKHTSKFSNANTFDEQDALAQMPAGGFDLADPGAGVASKMEQLKSGKLKSEDKSSAKAEDDLTKEYKSIKEKGAAKPQAKDKELAQDDAKAKPAKDTKRASSTKPKNDSQASSADAGATPSPQSQQDKEQAKPTAKEGAPAQNKTKSDKQNLSAVVDANSNTNPIANSDTTAKTKQAKIGSLRPTSRVKSYAENNPAISAEKMRVNYGEAGKPKNPLAADKSTMTKPVPSNAPASKVKRTVEDAIKAIHAVGGAFDLNDVKIHPKSDERDVYARIGTESGLVVETEGSNFELLAPDSAGDVQDIPLELEVKSMLQAAKEMGWDEIDIDGTPEFCEAAKRLSGDLGMKVVATVTHEHNAEKPVAPEEVAKQDVSRDADKTKQSNSQDDVQEPSNVVNWPDI